MVRRRTLPGGEEMVELVISGPRSILPGTRVVKVRPTQFWSEVLNNDLQLDVPLDRGIFVCNSKYCPSSPVAGQGWRNELTEMVGDYVNHFSRKLKQYRVRVCHPFDIDSFKSHRTSEGNPHPKTPTKLTPKRVPMKRPATEPRPGPVMMTFNQPEAHQGGKRTRQDEDCGVGSDLRSAVADLRRVKMELVDGSDEEEEEIPDTRDCDNDSLCTALDDQMEEFAREGIEMRDVKTAALMNLSKISNNVLLKINQEVDKLKKDNKWQRNVARSPLTCWLVQEILKK